MARIDCIAKNQTTEDGILISGHIYEDICAVIDQDTGRSYIVSRCMNCEKLDASFMETASEVGKTLLNRAPAILKVGDSNAS